MPAPMTKERKHIWPIRTMSILLIAMSLFAMGPTPEADAAEMTGNPYVSCGIGKVNVYPGVVGNYETFSMAFQVYKWVWTGSKWTIVPFGSPVARKVTAIPAGWYNAGYFVAPSKYVYPSGFYSVMLSMAWYDSNGYYRKWNGFVSSYKSSTGSVNGSYCLA